MVNSSIKKKEEKKNKKGSIPPPPPHNTHTKKKKRKEKNGSGIKLAQGFLVQVEGNTKKWTNLKRINTRKLLQLVKR